MYVLCVLKRLGPRANQGVGAWQPNRTWLSAGRGISECCMQRKRHPSSHSRSSRGVVTIILIGRLGGEIPSLNVRPISRCGVSASPVWSGGNGVRKCQGRLLDVHCNSRAGSSLAGQLHCCSYESAWMHVMCTYVLQRSQQRDEQDRPGMQVQCGAQFHGHCVALSIRL